MVKILFPKYNVGTQYPTNYELSNIAKKSRDIVIQIIDLPVSYKYFRY